MRLCAWCEREIGGSAAMVHGVLATTWGMCPECLSDRLAALKATPAQAPRDPLHPLDLTKPEAGRRVGEVT
jgi:hypothetical protein